MEEDHDHQLQRQGDTVVRIHKSKKLSVPVLKWYIDHSRKLSSRGFRLMVYEVSVTGVLSNPKALLLMLCHTFSKTLHSINVRI